MIMASKPSSYFSKPYRHANQMEQPAFPGSGRSPFVRDSLLRKNWLSIWNNHNHSRKSDDCYQTLSSESDSTHSELISSHAETLSSLSSRFPSTPNLSFAFERGGTKGGTKTRPKLHQSFLATKTSDLIGERSRKPLEGQTHSTMTGDSPVIYRGNIVRVHVPRYFYSIHDDSEKSGEIEGKVGREEKKRVKEEEEVEERKRGDRFNQFQDFHEDYFDGRPGFRSSKHRYHSDSNILEDRNYDIRENEFPTRSVVLRKQGGVFGFILCGAKSNSYYRDFELNRFAPSRLLPALQYLERVEKGSPADKARLSAGDFILEVNGMDVTNATHDRTVQLIKRSGDTLHLKVMTSPTFPSSSSSSSTSTSDGFRGISRRNAKNSRVPLEKFNYREFNHPENSKDVKTRGNQMDVRIVKASHPSVMLSPSVAVASSKSKDRQPTKTRKPFRDMTVKIPFRNGRKIDEMEKHPKGRVSPPPSFLYRIRKPKSMEAFWLGYSKENARNPFQRQVEDDGTPQCHLDDEINRAYPSNSFMRNGEPLTTTRPLKHCSNDRVTHNNLSCSLDDVLAVSLDSVDERSKVKRTFGSAEHLLVENTRTSRCTPNVSFRCKYHRIPPHFPAFPHPPGLFPTRKIVGKEKLGAPESKMQRGVSCGDLFIGGRWNLEGSRWVPSSSSSSSSFSSSSRLSVLPSEFPTVEEWSTSSGNLPPRQTTCVADHQSKPSNGKSRGNLEMKASVSSASDEPEDEDNTGIGTKNSVADSAIQKTEQNQFINPSCMKTNDDHSKTANKTTDKVDRTGYLVANNTISITTKEVERDIKDMSQVQTDNRQCQNPRETLRRNSEDNEKMMMPFKATTPMEMNPSKTKDTMPEVSGSDSSKRDATPEQPQSPKHGHGLKTNTSELTITKCAGDHSTAQRLLSPETTKIRTSGVPVKVSNSKESSGINFLEMAEAARMQYLQQKQRRITEQQMSYVSSHQGRTAQQQTEVFNRTSATRKQSFKNTDNQESTSKRNSSCSQELVRGPVKSKNFSWNRGKENEKSSSNPALTSCKRAKDQSVMAERKERNPSNNKNTSAVENGEARDPGKSGRNLPVKPVTASPNASQRKEEDPRLNPEEHSKRSNADFCQQSGELLKTNNRTKTKALSLLSFTNRKPVTRVKKLMQSFENLTPQHQAIDLLPEESVSLTPGSETKQIQETIPGKTESTLISTKELGNRDSKDTTGLQPSEKSPRLHETSSSSLELSVPPAKQHGATQEPVSGKFPGTNSQITNENKPKNASGIVNGLSLGNPAPMLAGNVRDSSQNPGESITSAEQTRKGTTGPCNDLRQISSDKSHFRNGSEGKTEHRSHETAVLPSKKISVVSGNHQIPTARNATLEEKTSSKKSHQNNSTSQIRLLPDLATRKKRPSEDGGSIGSSLATADSVQSFISVAPQYISIVGSAAPA